MPRSLMPRSARWKLPLLVGAFCAWRLVFKDYWGTIFGVLLAFCLAVRPQTEIELATWRRVAYRLGVSVFVVTAIIAAWKSIHE
jgi:hypothetical protein